MQRPFDEQPLAQSASLVQFMPGLSEVDKQVPRVGPLGLSGQLSVESGTPSSSLSLIYVVVELRGGKIVVVVIPTEVVELVVGTVVDSSTEVVVVATEVVELVVGAVVVGSTEVVVVSTEVVELVVGAVVVGSAEVVVVSTEEVELVIGTVVVNSIEVVVVVCMVVVVVVLLNICVNSA